MKLNFKWLKTGDALFRLLAMLYAGVCCAISGAVLDQTRLHCIPIQKDVTKKLSEIKALDTKLGKYTADNIEKQNASAFERSVREYQILVPLEAAWIYLFLLALIGLLAICFICSIVNFFMKLCTCVNLTGVFWWFDVIFHTVAGFIIYLYGVFLFIKLVRSEEGNGHLTSECREWHEVKGNTSAEKEWRKADVRKDLFENNKHPLICLSELGHHLRMLDGLLGIFIGVLYLAICVGLVANKLKEIAEIEKAQMEHMEQESKVWIEKDTPKENVNVNEKSPEEKISPKPSEQKIIPKLSDAKKLSQSSEKKLSTSPEENIIPKSSEQNIEPKPSEKKLSKSSEKKLSKSSEKKLSKSSENKLSASSDVKKLSTSSDAKTILTSKPSQQSIIAPKPSEQKIEKLPEDTIEKTPVKVKGPGRRGKMSAQEKRRKSMGVSFSEGPAATPAPPPRPTPAPSRAPLPPPEKKKEDPTGGNCRIA